MHPNGYIPYQVDLTPALRFGSKKNKLKIITQSRQPSSRWYSGGGLDRDVCLWVGGPVCVKPWDIFITTLKVENARAVVKVEADITGTDKEQEIIYFCEISDECRNVVGKVEKSLKICGKLKDISEIIVEKPVLWNLETPYLYHCKITIENNGEIMDVAEDTFGIRTIEADVVNGFRLNGKKINLKGGCIHHDNGFLGACAYPKAEERKMRTLKKMGYNTVRIVIIRRLWHFLKSVTELECWLWMRHLMYGVLEKCRWIIIFILKHGGLETSNIWYVVTEIIHV